MMQQKTVELRVSGISVGYARRGVRSMQDQLKIQKAVFKQHRKNVDRQRYENRQILNRLSEKITLFM